MRSAIIGAGVADADRRVALVRASTLITHTDPKAEQGAQVVALAAHIACASTPLSPGEFRGRLTAVLDTDAVELLGLLNHAIDSVLRGESTSDFATALGQGEGVTGYVLDTVPVAMHACLSHPRDFRSAVMSVIECGGDTDTEEWIEGLKEWPRSTRWMTRLGQALANVDGAARPPRLFVLSILLRNLFFLAIVLLHGFRRMLPPY